MFALRLSHTFVSATKILCPDSSSSGEDVACAAVALALTERMSTGEGRLVTTSLYATGIFVNAPTLLRPDVVMVPAGWIGDVVPMNPFDRRETIPRAEQAVEQRAEPGVIEERMKCARVVVEEGPNLAAPWWLRGGFLLARGAVRGGNRGVKGVNEPLEVGRRDEVADDAETLRLELLLCRGRQHTCDHAVIVAVIYRRPRPMRARCA